jgi:hypothetical protein
MTLPAQFEHARGKTHTTESLQRLERRQRPMWLLQVTQDLFRLIHFNLLLSTHLRMTWLTV